MVFQVSHRLVITIRFILLCHFSMPHRYIYFSSGAVHMVRISGSIRVRIPQKHNVVAVWSCNLGVMVFQSWNLDVVGFCPLKKCLGITMSWFNCLRSSMLWCFSPRISMSRFLVFESRYRDFLVLGSRCCIYISTASFSFSSWKQNKSSKNISIILLKNTSVIQIYATAICIIHA